MRDRKLRAKEWRDVLPKLPWVYILRWLRLVVPMIFVMLWMIGISPLFWEVGPAPNPKNCKNEDFLYNMLFLVRDVYDGMDGITHTCIGQTWYLWVDMRVFIFIPIIAIVNNFASDYLAMVGVFAAWLGGTIDTGMHYHKYDIFPSIANPPDAVFDPNEIAREYNSYFAIRYRFPAMLVGVMFALLWHKYLKDIPRWTRVQQCAIFSAMSVFLMSTCYGMYSAYQHAACTPVNPTFTDCGSGWSTTKKALFGALNRSVWCMGLSLLCCLCFKDQFPFANAFLSHDFQKPLARLSFMMYLTQIEVSNYFLRNSNVVTRYSIWYLVWQYMGFLGSVILASIFMHCIAEAPFNKLIGNLLGGFVKKAQPRKEDSLLPPENEKKKRLSGASLNSGEEETVQPPRYSNVYDPEVGSEVREV